MPEEVYKPVSCNCRANLGLAFVRLGEELNSFNGFSDGFSIGLSLRK